MEGDHNTTVHTAHFVPPTATVPTDRKPEPTADKEPELAEMPEPMPEPYIAQEPKSNTYDEVHESETLSFTEGELVEYERMVWSPIPSRKASVNVAVMRRT